MGTLEKEKQDRIAKSKTIARFIQSIRGTSALLAQFDETLWLAIIDIVTVTKDGGMIFRFKNGSEITI
jgi:site-specific DNA recombinase